MHQGPGDGDPLLLAARELTRQIGQTVTEAKPFEEVGGHLDRMLSPPSGDQQRHRGIFHRGECWQQIVGLEDEAHVFPTEADDAMLGHRREVIAQHTDLTFGGFEGSCDDRHQGCLPAATWADEHQQLTVGNVEINTPQGECAGIAAAKRLLHAANADGEIGGSRIHRCGVVCHPYPRKTIAGSTTSTLRMESTLATSTITNTAAAVRASTCQGMKKESRVVWPLHQPKAAASPTPTP